MAEVCPHIPADVYPHGEFHTLLREHSENYYNDSMFKKVQIQKFEENDGFNSEIFKVTAYDDGNHAHYMILKIPCVDKFIEKLEDVGQEIGEDHEVNSETVFFHNRECAFYAFSKQIRGVPLPRVCAMEKSIPSVSLGGILMEDLSAKTTSLKLYDSFNMQQILNLTTNLAHLHSFSMFFPKESLKNLNLRDRFYEDCADFNSKFAEKTMKIFPQLQQYYEQFYNLIRSKEFAEYSVIGIAKELGMPEVIVHGDLFCNNILWKKNADQTCSDEVGAIIDWQMIHTGCAVEDLSKILVVCTNTETRRLAENLVFDTYLEVLTNDMNDANRTAPFTKQQLEKAYRLSFINQVFFLLFGISFFIQDVVFASKSRSIQRKLRGLASRAEYALIDATHILENDLSKWIL